MQVIYNYEMQVSGGNKMEELVYTILYKKELLSEEENSYHFTPCYIVKGLYD